MIADLIVEVAAYVRSPPAVARLPSTACPSELTPAVHPCQLFRAADLPRQSRALHSPVEKRMAERMQPFGIHHCGGNMDRVLRPYAQIRICLCRCRLGFRFGRLPPGAARGGPQTCAAARSACCPARRRRWPRRPSLSCFPPVLSKRPASAASTWITARLTTTCLLCTRWLNGIADMGLKGE